MGSLALQDLPLSAAERIPVVIAAGQRRADPDDRDRRQFGVRTEHLAWCALLTHCSHAANLTACHRRGDRCPSTQNQIDRAGSVVSGWRATVSIPVRFSVPILEWRSHPFSWRLRTS